MSGKGEARGGLISSSSASASDFEVLWVLSQLEVRKQILQFPQESFLGKVAVTGSKLLFKKNSKALLLRAGITAQRPSSSGKRRDCSGALISQKSKRTKGIRQNVSTPTYTQVICVCALFVLCKQKRQRFNTIMKGLCGEICRKRGEFSEEEPRTEKHKPLGSGRMGAGYSLLLNC